MKSCYWIKNFFWFQCILLYFWTVFEQLFQFFSVRWSYFEFTFATFCLFVWVYKNSLFFLGYSSPHLCKSFLINLKVDFLVFTGVIKIYLLTFVSYCLVHSHPILSTFFMRNCNFFILLLAPRFISSILSSCRCESTAVGLLELLQKRFFTSV